MKKMDEMERNIQLRSEEWGYRAALLALSAWTLFCSLQTLIYDVELNPLPSLILCFIVCVQGFSQMVMKKKMVDGDEEYQESNKLIWKIIAFVVVTMLILSIGNYFLVGV